MNSEIIPKAFVLDCLHSGDFGTQHNLLPQWDDFLKRRETYECFLLKGGDCKSGLGWGTELSDFNVIKTSMTYKASFYRHWPLKETITAAIKKRSVCRNWERGVSGKKVEKQLYNSKVSEERGGGGTPGAEVSRQSLKITVDQAVTLQPMQRTMGEKIVPTPHRKDLCWSSYWRTATIKRDVGAGDKCEEGEEAERSCCGLIPTPCSPYPVPLGG